MSLCHVYEFGQVLYLESWHWQRSLVEARRVDPSLPDVLLLLEHPEVYTLGKGAKQEFLKFDPNSKQVPVHRIERGGEVTHHCPDQLVGYPILNLRRYRMDLHWYLRQLEEVLIQAIAKFGLEGQRVEGLTGVWVEGRKVAAIGIKVSRWITMHGFALNICPDLSGFADIVPCGIADRPVGSLAEFLPSVSKREVCEAVKTAFSNVFQTSLIVQHYSDPSNFDPSRLGD